MLHLRVADLVPRPLVLLLTMVAIEHPAFVGIPSVTLKVSEVMIWTDMVATGKLTM